MIEINRVGDNVNRYWFECSCGQMFVADENECEFDKTPVERVCKCPECGKSVVGTRIASTAVNYE